jgi:hypothetical protein
MNRLWWGSKLSWLGWSLELHLDLDLVFGSLVLWVEPVSVILTNADLTLSNNVTKLNDLVEVAVSVSALDDA